jgi:hypothetical protein
MNLPEIEMRPQQNMLAIQEVFGYVSSASPDACRNLRRPSLTRLSTDEDFWMMSHFCKEVAPFISFDGGLSKPERAITHM